MNKIVLHITTQTLSFAFRTLSLCISTLFRTTVYTDYKKKVLSNALKDRIACLVHEDFLLL